MATCPNFASLKSTRPNPSLLRQVRNTTTFSDFSQLRQGFQAFSQHAFQGQSFQESKLAYLPSEDVYDEHPSTETDEDEYEDDSVMTAVGHRYDQLPSLRDPSPTGAMLFTSDEPDYDTLPSDRAAAIEDAFCALATSIGCVFVSYRSELDKWLHCPQPPQSVLKASAIVDQCLLKVVVYFEPIKRLAEMFGNLRVSFETFRVGLHPSQLHHRNEQACAQFWNSLSALADEVNLLDDTLSDMSLDFNELCDWLDGFLTPVLAELKLPSSSTNAEVSHILDVHSYLCEAMSKTSWFIKLFVECIKKISESTESFEKTFCEATEELKADRLASWAYRWSESLVHMAGSLAILGSISNHIQRSTAGTHHAVSL